MHFTNKKLRALGYPGGGVVHLRSRQRGASAATGGFHYQRCFAVLRVLELAASQRDGRVFLDALCPVDDVVVESGGHHEHSQVKESATATWGRNGGQLRREFLAQDKLMRRAGVARYSLQIVTPHAHRVRHFRDAVTPSLKPVFRVRRFPRPKIAHQPWVVPDVARALDALLFLPLGGHSQRERLWVAVDKACQSPWSNSRVSSVVRRAAKFDRDLYLPDPLRRSVAPERDVVAAIDILNGVVGLDAQVVDGICFLDYAGVSRRFVARTDDVSFRRFIRRILQRRPSDYGAVCAELP